MSIWKKIKKAVKSVGKEVERVPGVADVNRTLHSVGGIAEKIGNQYSSEFIEPLNKVMEEAIRATGDVVKSGWGMLPGDIATTSSSAIPTSGPGPNVDLAATESRRRNTGTAKGSRKLKVPLGGLRR